MPKIRPGMKKPPPGFDLISDKLDEYDEQMHLAIQEESTGVIGQTRKKRGRDKTSKKQNIVRNTCKEAKYEEETEPQQQEDENENDTHKDNEDHTSSAVKQHYEEQVSEQQEEEEEEEQEQEQEQQSIPPMWKIAQINAARTRYVFDAYYRQHCISQEVFDYCCEMQFIDGGLARRWKLPGYEKLCCNACALPGAASLAASRNAKYAHRHSAERKHYHNNSNSSSSSAATCICRVPASQRRSKSFLRCSVCGCTGCCSSDTAKTEEKEKEKQLQEEEEEREENE